MSFQPIAADLNPDDYVVVPHVAALDEFRMTNDQGEFVANITKQFIQRLVAHMNEREAATGDLAPIVIGHTINGLPETEQPPVVGFARNWHDGELGSTGRWCAFFDAWILKDRVEQCKSYPRRSCEVWVTRHECDPISLLGATTPARDLGLLKLSRDGSLTYGSPGEMNMPAADPKGNMNEKTDKPKDTKESGESKGLEGLLQQILAQQTELLNLLKGGMGAATSGDANAAAGAPGAGAPADAGTASPDGQMSDEEYNQLMQELLAEPQDKGSRAGAEGPTKNSGATCYPNGQASTTVPNYEHGKKGAEKMQRSAEGERLAQVEAELARMQIKDRLVKLQRQEIADPDDETLIAELAAMPAELRNKIIDRFGKAPAAPSNGSVNLSRAIDAATPNATGTGKRITSREEMTRLQRRAVTEKKTFEQVATEDGYDLN